MVLIRQVLLPVEEKNSGTLDTSALDSRYVAIIDKNKFKNDVDIGDNKIKNLDDPTSGKDAVNKNYIDNMISITNFKQNLLDKAEFYMSLKPGYISTKNDYVNSLMSMSRYDYTFSHAFGTKLKIVKHDNGRFKYIGNSVSAAGLVAIFPTITKRFCIHVTFKNSNPVDGYSLIVSIRGTYIGVLHKNKLVTNNNKGIYTAPRISLDSSKIYVASIISNDNTMSLIINGNSNSYIPNDITADGSSIYLFNDSSKRYPFYGDIFLLVYVPGGDEINWSDNVKRYHKMECEKYGIIHNG